MTVSREGKPVDSRYMTALLTPYKNYDGYIYNLKLNISISSDEGYANRGRILKAIAALIAARIVHKYPMWKVISNVLFMILLDELTLQLPSFISELLWKSNVDIRAYKFGIPLDLDTPIIYDDFHYSGSLQPVTIGSDEFYSKSVELSYSMTLYISPALEAALPFYKAERYRCSDNTGISASTLIYYFNFLNRIKYDADYDHHREWMNIIELTDYQNELTDKISVIEKLKALKGRIESTLQVLDKNKSG